MFWFGATVAVSVILSIFGGVVEFRPFFGFVLDVPLLVTRLLDSSRLSC